LPENARLCQRPDGDRRQHRALWGDLAGSCWTTPRSG